MYESSEMLSTIGTVGIIVYLAIFVFMIASLWKIFEKAGKPGWAAIVPLYNVIVLLEIVGKPIWWILLYLIPLVNIVVIIIMTNLLSKSFGKGVGYTIGMIFLPFIFVPILGFGSASYEGAVGGN